jgi:hypothetical protein
VVALKQQKVAKLPPVQPLQLGPVHPDIPVAPEEPEQIKLVHGPQEGGIVDCLVG